MPSYGGGFADWIKKDNTTTYIGSAFNIATDSFREVRTLGAKQYELSDHLGNVLVSALDKKTGYGDSTSGGLHYYRGYYANLSSVTDYYPFGMVMPGRSRQSPLSLGYRGGFNGKENDDEVYGFDNFQDYGRRMYDPRTARLGWSMDPMARDYPWYSTYQFAGNTPIMASDLDGAEPDVKIGDALKATADAATAYLQAANTAAKVTSDVDAQINVGAAQFLVNGLYTASAILGAKPDGPSSSLKVPSRGCATPLTKDEQAENLANMKAPDPFAPVKRDIYTLYTGDISEKTTASLNLISLLVPFMAEGSVATSSGAGTLRDMGLGMIRTEESTAIIRPFKPFTANNYRINLKLLTGEDGVGLDAHHIFPQAKRFQGQWDRVGLNIHDPNNMSWWPSGSHQKAAYGYNKAWDGFFRQYPKATLQQIKSFGNDLMKSYKP